MVDSWDMRGAGDGGRIGVVMGRVGDSGNNCEH